MTTVLMYAVRRSVQEGAPPLVQQSAARAVGRSVDTLVVIVAAIALTAVLAGVLARVCGGRQVAAGGDRDVEGWVERRCRSCLDSGLPPPPQRQGSPKTSEAK